MTKLAFLFPGQGSQSIGMLSDWADESVVTRTFDEASEVLGYNLWEMCQHGPDEAINLTQRTQPALLTASVALWRLWQEKGGPTPEIMAGHSLGEYSALVCAGSLDFAETVDLVQSRGQFMQDAVPAGEGKMAAILGLDDAHVIAVCEAAADGEVVSAVNFNSPGQVVIAGNAKAVERAMSACQEKGARRALELPVSAPSHCALMHPAAQKLEQKLQHITVHTPKIQVLHNVDVASHESADAIKDALIKQLYSPVRWTETVQALVSQGVDYAVECGPGNVLAGLAKRIERSLPVVPVAGKDKFEQAITLS